MTVYQYGFWNFGVVGATIIYIGLLLISLLFLTNFRLSQWIQMLIPKKDPAAVAAAAAAKTAGKTREEIALEKRARELEKQSKKLQEQVDKATGVPAKPTGVPAASGLGADMQPVPEPTVRDLSVPQAKVPDGPRITKTTLPARKDAKEAKESTPPPEAVVVSARELGTASTADILGQKPETKAEGKKAEPDDEASPFKDEEETPEAPDATAPPIIRATAPGSRVVLRSKDKVSTLPSVTAVTWPEGAKAKLRRL